MFDRLFADRGLSLDRLRALLKVAASGSIAKAADNNPVKQSQFSRQIKELEDFFQVRLLGRHGKGIHLTARGKELALISRLYLRALANFQRGCLAEEQSFRIGASATFIETFLLPLLASPRRIKAGPHFAVEVVPNDEIERRLHDLTLDFGIVTTGKLSRPLQLKELGQWQLILCVPKSICKTEKKALASLAAKTLPMAFPALELPLAELPSLAGYSWRLTCNSFAEAKIAMQMQNLATFLPDFLLPTTTDSLSIRDLPGLQLFQYRLAWNPRLLRLNPPAARTHGFLADSMCNMSVQTCLKQQS